MGDSSSPGPNIETFVVGESSPTSVIPKEKSWYVQVTWQMTGTYLGLTSGSWVVHVFLESIGPIESSSALPDKRFTVPLILGPDPINYGPINCEYEAHSLGAGVYKVTASITAIDPNGNPLPMIGFAEKIIAITPELDPSVAIDQAILTGIKVAAAEQAISIGVPVTTEGNTVSVTSEGVEVKSSKGLRIVIPNDKAFDKIGDSTKSVDTQLQQINTEIRILAQRWNLVSLGATIVSIFLIGTGVVMLLTGDTTTGIVSMISSIIPETVTALCFVQSRKANQRVDKVRDQLFKIHVMNENRKLIDKIEDSTSRDKLITEYVNKIVPGGKKGA